MDNLENYNPDQQAAPTGVSAGTVDGQNEAKRNSLNTVALKSEEISEWWSRIKKSEDRTKARAEKWDILMKEYLPTVKASGDAEDAKTNAHFRNVHTKIGQVFVQSPEIRLTPKGPALDVVQMPTPMGVVTMSPEECIAVKQALINEKMGPEEIDGSQLMDECLFDQMAWAGLSAVKVGYRQVTKIYNKPVMQPDPDFVPPPQTGVLGLAPAPPPPMIPVIDRATGQPQTEPIPVPVYEEYYATRFSPKKLLLDDKLKSSNVRKYSRWIGSISFLPKRIAIREFGLTEEELASATEDDKVFKYDDDSKVGEAAAKDDVKVYEVYYKASYFTDTEIHPDVIYQLILIEGIQDRTIVSRMSPDQTLDEYGGLTPDSLLGFPILVGSLRTSADTPFPEADSAFTNIQAKGLNTHRRQAFKLRDNQIGKYLYDTEALDEKDLGRIQNGDVGEFIGVKPGMLKDGPDRIITPINTVKSTADDYRLASVLKADMDETLGISAAQAGTPLSTVHSATEVAQFSADAAGRQEKEKARAVQYYLNIVRAVDTLLVRYSKGSDYITIVGEDGAQKIMRWNKKVISGKYSYDIKPDSQLKSDAARDRQQKLTLYNLTAQDPLVNRAPILRDLARDFGYDPTRILVSPQMGMMQPPHGGPLNKHAMEQSGQRPGGTPGDNRNERTGNAPGQPTTPPSPAAAKGPSGHPAPPTPGGR